MADNNITKLPVPRWAWTVFVVFVFSWAALQSKYPRFNPPRSSYVPPASENAVACWLESENDLQSRERVFTENKRRGIYMMAMRTRGHIEFAQETGSNDEHIEQLEQMHEKRLGFTTRFHNITRAQLNEIIAEGDRNGWPTD